MKRVEPGFSVSDFVQGSRGAYEMIVMGFERGDLNDIQPFLAEDVFETFVSVVSDREDQGLKIEAEFIEDVARELAAGAGKIGPLRGMPGDDALVL